MRRPGPGRQSLMDKESSGGLLIEAPLSEDRESH